MRPIAFFALILAITVLQSCLVFYTVRYFHTGKQVTQLTYDLTDAVGECGRLNHLADFWMDQVKSAGDIRHALEDENAQLRKDISETEGELTSSRAERRPFDPKSAGTTRVLTQIVAAECGPTATYDECRMVAQVVVNRANKYQQTVLEVVTLRNQFAPVTSGAWLWAMPTPVETAAAYNAVNRIDEVVLPISARQILYFCAVGHEDEFFRTKLVLDRRIGDTAFYREKEGMTMKNIVKLLDKAIEELEKSLSTYKTCYDLHIEEIAKLKALLIEKDNYLSQMDGIGERCEKRINELEERIKELTDANEAREYEKHVEEVTSRGE